MIRAGVIRTDSHTAYLARDISYSLSHGWRAEDYCLIESLGRPMFARPGLVWIGAGSFGNALVDPVPEIVLSLVTDRLDD